MEFIDDDWDSQPRARVVHTRGKPDATGAIASSSAQASRSLPHTAACTAAAVLLLASAYYLLPAYQIFASVVVWIACSLLLAPFAPSSATGGDISVGRGPLLPEQELPEGTSFGSRPDVPPRPAPEPDPRPRPRPRPRCPQSPQIR
ncbi:hypothetical protein GUJ93_ZPchr0147g2927 [Zizania palustris]|uniref:Uncharacterized protein n=1 Tax=Zizania palustris TaxID=103762 RepID=A0A8J5RRL8_ZIZPA|nr:hypothetical protein GUJ93_ZPchr0147g2927 [Zizania palustris]